MATRDQHANTPRQHPQDRPGDAPGDSRSRGRSADRERETSGPGWRPGPRQVGRSSAECYSFKRRECRNGTKCPFSHDLEPLRDSGNPDRASDRALEPAAYDREPPASGKSSSPKRQRSPGPSWNEVDARTKTWRHQDSESRGWEKGGSFRRHEDAASWVRRRSPEPRDGARRHVDSETYRGRREGSDRRR